MRLTKTDFVQYLNCPKSLWLMLNKAEQYKFDEPNLFDQKLIEEGYVFEGYVKQLIVSWPDAATFDYQAVFETDYLYARLDLAKHRDDGLIDIYEIKSSTSVKKRTPARCGFPSPCCRTRWH